MELRQLKYFIAAAELGSISEASRSLYIAQPALTKQIQLLESEIGVPLLARLPRGVALTAAGKQFLAGAKRIIEEINLAKQQAVRASNGKIGNLSVGIAILHYLPPDVAATLKTFRDALPDVSISLRQVLSSPQIDMIRNGELDAGFLFFRPTSDESLRGLLFTKQRLVLAMPKEPSWTDNPPKRLSDLKGRNFVWFPRNATPLYHDQIIACFRKHGFVPNVVVEGIDNHALLTLVAAGMGCAVLPDLARGLALPQIEFVELEDLDLDMPLEFVWRADNDSPVLQQLIAIARDFAHGTGSSGRDVEPNAAV
ncbi:LysR family transcriptional regulator [Burkholderia lata]|uniref:LysR family transcriptional regulator n=1 Tax=Burkholderia lata (strain ATCC 17760 / DSM 23089 / LMG 22485 / NCIMB 9086 / R18194 / 383) TaxID=482957 RepID=A0A6P2V4G3_BURL3|nr:LysR family transcriptional regulator [Burkholderia lata]VWC75977.1 LysR family transcriptional regulator [Burkholderia lata]